jgi:DNA-binding Xre family transcriptional regulator
MQGNELMSYFKTNVKQLMLEKSVKVGHSLTMSEVAEATGLSLPTISRWHKGQIDRVESDTIEKLTAYFDCRFEDLVQYMGE